MSIQLRNLTKYTGGEVSGVDLRQPLGKEVRAMVNRALDERGILVFHGQDLDPIAFGKAVENFGALMEQQRSEEHTSELQSLMRTSYAVFCLKKKNQTNETT